MHTVYRVYGNAIGRTALGCRTVGRGFKSVARMKGGVLPDDRPAYHDYRSEYEPSVSAPSTTESEYYEQWNDPRDIHFVNEAPGEREFNLRNDLINIEQRRRRGVRNAEEDRQHQENVKRMNKWIALDDAKKLKKEMEETKFPEIEVDKTIDLLIKQLNKKNKNNVSVEDTMQILNDVKQNTCWICKITFSNQGNLRTHVRTAKIHKQNSIKIFGEDIPDPTLQAFVKEAKVVGENGEVHEDEGFLQNETIAVAENRVSQLVFDDKLIYKEHEYGGEQLGTWNPNYDDFNELENTDLNQDEIIDIDSTILNQNRSAEYLKSLPELTKQLAGSIYKAKKVDGKVVKDDNGHAVLTTEIKQSRVWEYGMCGSNNNEASKVFSSVLHEGRRTDFKTSDEIAVTYNITGGNSLPVDLIDKKNGNASESKYYTKVEYVRMYNINMKFQKHYYEKQKVLLKQKILDIQLNQEDREAIKIRDETLKILNSKQSFLRSFYANTNYMSVNIGAGKWGGVPDNVTDNIQDGLANSVKQINIYKGHAAPKIQLSFNEKRRMIQWNVKDDNKSKKRSKEQLTDELSNAFFKNDKGKSIKYCYTVNVKFKDGVGLYNYTKDDYLNDCKHIVQGYKIGVSYDQHEDKGLFMDAIKIPIEKFIPFGLKFRKKSEIIVLDSESDED